MDPFVSSIQDTERAHSSNRSVLGSLPDNWFNSQSNQDYTQHESPLHASAEALLLLNNAQFSHANFADSGSFPAQKENLSTQFGGIPITAPVPLSYAVRGKAALKSILSIGEDDGEDENDSDPVPQKLNESVTIEESQVFEDTAIGAFPQIEVTVPTPGPILPILPIFDIPQNRALVNDQPWPAVTEGLATRPFVRSISPSTLMALTEPCLMAWCFDPDLDFNTNPQVSSMSVQQVYNVSSVPAVYDAPLSADYVMPVNRNVWGY